MDWKDKRLARAQRTENGPEARSSQRRRTHPVRLGLPGLGRPKATGSCSSDSSRVGSGTPRTRGLVRELEALQEKLDFEAGALGPRRLASPMGAEALSQGSSGAYRSPPGSDRGCFAALFATSTLLPVEEPRNAVACVMLWGAILAKGSASGFRGRILQGLFALSPYSPKIPGRERVRFPDRLLHCEATVK